MEKIVYNVTFYFKIHEQDLKKRAVFLDLLRINLDIAYLFISKIQKNMMVKYVENAWIKI